MNFKSNNSFTVKSKPKNNTFNAHETERMHLLDGVELASFKSRLFAFIIDFFAAIILFGTLFFLVGLLLEKFGWVSPEAKYRFEFDFHNWYSVVLMVLYFGLFTYFGNGQTPGKRLMKIRIVSLVHEKISLWHSIERSLGYGASALEFGFGFLQYFIHPNKRTVHDRIAETIVIKDKRETE